jgi:hypothetical protein
MAVPAAVQRQTEEGAAGPASTAQAAEGNQQDANQDLESMAQEVYRIIRQRLAIEREREEGRR